MGSEHPQQSPALAVEFDFYDQEFQNEPHNKYLEMIDKCPFHREPDLGWHAVFRHADIMDIVRNNEQFTVLDNTGHYEALGIAEHLVTDGAHVTFVSPFKQLGYKVENALMVEPVLEPIGAASGSLEVHLRHRILSVREGEAEIAPTFAVGPVRTLAADTVVLVTPNAPINDVQAALEGQVAVVKAVGDALSPRTLQAAIREGHVAARAL